MMRLATRKPIPREVLMCVLRKIGPLPLVLLIALCLPDAVEPSFAEQEGPQQNPGQEMAAPPLIARATARFERDHKELHVYRGGQLVELAPFRELIAVTPQGRAEKLKSLVGKTVTLVSSLHNEGQWDIYTGVGAVGELTLAGNIFTVGQVVLPGPAKLIEVRTDRQTHRLKPAQALIVLR
jgi:hypothetical protein